LVEGTNVANEEIDKRDEDIHQLKIENDRRGKESIKAMQKYQQLVEEIKLKDNLISEFQKKT
jgi:uncharacterized ubiquitin-like protein YukD